MECEVFPDICAEATALCHPIVGFLSQEPPEETYSAFTQTSLNELCALMRHNCPNNRMRSLGVNTGEHSHGHRALLLSIETQVRGGARRKIMSSAWGRKNL